MKQEPVLNGDTLPTTPLRVATRDLKIGWAALENENEYLREDLRDYKLLRKVFGSKQIDALLEQARANKGKRRNERSR